MDRPIFDSIEAKTARPLFFFADHASFHVPEHYNFLGLHSDEFYRHIGWDIGTELVARNLCERFGVGGHFATHSRLLIDVHRSPDATDLIPAISDGTIIPGNVKISDAERQRRIATYHTPYHAGLANAIDGVCATTIDPIIISIHSFTPTPRMGEPRTLDLGMLWKANEMSSACFADHLRAVHPYKVGLNVPYSGLRFNHTIDHHVIPRGLRHLTFEIRKDLINSPDGIAAMSKHLAQALLRFEPSLA